MAARSTSVSAQLIAPALGPDILPRARLLGLLRSATAYKVVLLSADAGYGKTTLLTQFCAASDGTAIWYALTSYDADLSVFLRQLADGIGLHFRTARKILDRYLQTHPSPHLDLGGAARVFADALGRSARRDYFILLDDVHTLRGSPFVPAFLSAFVDLLPSQFHLVLASRHDPPLPIPLWRARRQLMDVRGSDLSFLPEELRALFARRLRVDLTDSDSELLLRRTEGWAAGLAWIAERMKLSPESMTAGDSVEDLANAPGGLSEFYEAELFRALPEVEQRFLLRVASLESFSPDLIQIAWKGRDRSEILKSLVRRNLLTSTPRRQKMEFRLHPLFREFLQERAREALPAGERTRILTELGRKLLVDDPAAGLEQWRLIPAPELIGEWLTEHGTELLSGGRYGHLSRLLEEFPREQLEGNPALRWLRGENRRILGDARGALEDFKAVERAAASRGLPELVAEAALGEAKVHTARGEVARSLQIGRRLLRSCVGLKPKAKAKALQITGGALFYLGRFREAGRVTREMREHLREYPNAELELAAEHNLALISCATGRFLEARGLFAELLRRPEVRDSRRLPLHLSNLAILQMECGEEVRARETLLQAEARVRLGGGALTRASVLLARGELELRLGNLAGVQGVCQELEGAGLPLDDRMVEVGRLALLARCAWRQGTSTESRRIAAEGLRMLGEDRGAFWFDLRLLELETDLSDGRALSASAGLRKLQMAARSRELLHIETRCALLRARALFEAGSSEALREMGRALSVCEREQYEQMTLEAASSAPELAGEAWAHGLSGEFLSRVFGRQPDRLWPPALRAARGSDKFPRLSALLADWGTPECIPLLQEWAARPGPSGRAAGRALEVARRRLGRRGAVPGSGVLDMRLLGPLEIRVRGERLSLRAFRTERAAQVFALLALRGKSGEDRERLLEMFWPRSPLAEARRNLSPTLSYIREAIRSGLPDMEPLDREEGRVRLSADLRLSWDLDAAAGFERAGTEGPEAHEKAEIFLDAWRGAFLEGWDAPWIETERRRLESLRRRASLLLASRDRQAGSLEAAERRLRAHLEGEPLDEEAHRELLETLARRGDFAQAWSEHRSFLERLARDAGGAPEPLTLSLVKRLRTIQKESAN